MQRDPPGPSRHPEPGQGTAAPVPAAMLRATSWTVSAFSGDDEYTLARMAPSTRLTWDTGAPGGGQDWAWRSSSRSAISGGKRTARLITTRSAENAPPPRMMAAVPMAWGHSEQSVTRSGSSSHGHGLAGSATDG